VVLPGCFILLQPFAIMRCKCHRSEAEWKRNCRVLVDSWLVDPLGLDMFVFCNGRVDPLAIPAAML
jgi:hypothetical protein